MNEVLLPFALLMGLAASWLVHLARLLERLSTFEPSIYRALGRPVLRLLFWEVPAARHERAEQLQPVVVETDERRREPDYPLEELRRISNLLEFIAGGRFRMMRDAEARLLGERLRVILALFPLGLIGFVIAAARP